ncbi:hypothetical protein TrVE_jg5442 [Triparma verrucosa]|uniref:Uncharacterized protein n=1 Tax=Triparma verrucosa TaxID=1606542 RepID=A0A9W7F527_9STRA|nr:hypothetical protein TrVE_jg5442 [Triparma verrucosa]
MGYYNSTGQYHYNDQEYIPSLEAESFQTCIEDKFGTAFDDFLDREVLYSGDFGSYAYLLPFLWCMLITFTFYLLRRGEVFIKVLGQGKIGLARICGSRIRGDRSEEEGGNRLIEIAQQISQERKKTEAEKVSDEYVFLTAFTTNKINETVAGVCALYPPLYLYLKMLGKPDDCFEGARVIEGSFDFYSPLVFMYLGLAHLRANWFRKWVAWRLNPKKNNIRIDRGGDRGGGHSMTFRVNYALVILVRRIIPTCGLYVAVLFFRYVIQPWLIAHPAGCLEKHLYLVLSLYILFDCALAIWMLCFIPQDQADSVTNVFGMFRLVAETFESFESVLFICFVFLGWFVDFEKERIERSLALLKERRPGPRWTQHKITKFFKVLLPPSEKLREVNRLWNNLEISEEERSEFMERFEMAGKFTEEGLKMLTDETDRLVPLVREKKSDFKELLSRPGPLKCFKKHELKEFPLPSSTYCDYCQLDLSKGTYVKACRRWSCYVNICRSCLVYVGKPDELPCDNTNEADTTNADTTVVQNNDGIELVAATGKKSTEEEASNPLQKPPGEFRLKREPSKGGGFGLKREDSVKARLPGAGERSGVEKDTLL